MEHTDEINNSNTNTKQSFNMDVEIADPNTVNIFNMNVEIFLRLYNYKFKFPNEIVKLEHNRDVEEAAINEDKLRSFLSLGANADVACFQEAVIPTNGNTRFDTYGDLNLVAQGKSHPLTWKKSVYLFGEECHLANNIYARDTIELVKQPLVVPISCEDVKPYNRNCVVANLRIKQTGVEYSQLCSHGSGGRLTDVWLYTKNNCIEISEKEIDIIIAQDADIICMDTNKKYWPSDKSIIEISESYRDSLIKEATASGTIIDESKESREDKWNKYCWLDHPNNPNSIHNKFLKAGYKAAYTGKDFQDSTMFTGVIDVYYYKKSRVTLVEGSVFIPSKDHVMRLSNGGKFKYEALLSDHFGFMASFIIKDKTKEAKDYFF